MSVWIKSLVGYMLIVSVVMQMLPNKKYEQYVKLFTGFLLIVLILQPVLKIGSASTFLEEQINKFVQEQENLEEQIGIQSEKLQIEDQERLGIEKVEKVKVEVKLDD